MTTAEILNLPLSEVNRIAKENPAQFRQITSALRSTAQKRLKVLEAESVVSPFVGNSFNNERLTGKVRGASNFAVRNQFTALRLFLSNPTTTKTGNRAFVQEIRARLKIPEGTSDVDLDRVLRLMGRAQQETPDLAAQLSSDELKRMCQQVVSSGQGKDLSEMFDTLTARLRGHYEDIQRRENAENGDFYELFDDEDPNDPWSDI